MLIELNNRIEEIDDKRIKTETDQKKLIETSSILNEKLRTFNDYKNLEKNAYREGVIKIQGLNQRINDCNSGIKNIKDKLQFLNLKLEKKNIISFDTQNQKSNSE